MKIISDSFSVTVCLLH